MVRGPDDPDVQPGSKVVLRLLDLLDSAGLSTAAARVVARYSPDIQTQLAAYRVGPAAPLALGGIAGYVEARAAEAAFAGDLADAGEMLAQARNADAPVWSSIGPTTIPNGQTYGVDKVNVSGRIAAIAVDPTNCKHLLVGAANGGVWESFDQGSRWLPRADDAPTLAVGALAFHPDDPSTVLCGTGEGNWWWWLGAGIRKSVDGGTTWTTLSREPFLGVGFFDLGYAPWAPSLVMAATSGGLFASTDGGASWTLRRANRTWSLAYGNRETLAGSDDGLQRSTDGGSTWNPEVLPSAPSTFARIAVAIAPTDQRIAFAFGADNSNNVYLWTRDVHGNWSAVPPPGGISAVQSWYDWFLAVDPSDAQRIYCGAIDAYRGEFDGTAWQWVDITTKSAPGSSSIHPDQHAIAFDPDDPRTIYVGCDGGLFTSRDQGDTWTSLNDNGLVISEFEYIAQDVNVGNWLIGGLQDNGTTIWTGTSAWVQVAEGDGGDCAVDRQNPSVVWHTFFDTTPQISRDTGATWNNTNPPVPAGEGSPFYPPVGASLSTGDTFAIAGNALYITRDLAATWVRIDMPPGASGGVVCVPDADNVWVGTTDGQLLHTTWGGGSWQDPLQQLTSPRPGAYLSDLHVAGDVIWVTSRTIQGGRVFRSGDGGTTWDDVSSGLPPLPINTLAFDDRDPERVWVGADLGVYETRDGGSTWAPFGAGLPNAFVGDLLFNPTWRLLRAATRNRGVWEIPADRSPAPQAAAHRQMVAPETARPPRAATIKTPKVTESGRSGKGPVQAKVKWTPDPTATSSEVVVTPGLRRFVRNHAAPSAEQTMVVPDLALGTDYSFEVVGVNQNGKGAPQTVTKETPAPSTSPAWFASSWAFLGLLLVAAALCGAGALFWSHPTTGQKTAFYSSALALFVLFLAFLFPAVTGGAFGVWRILLGKDQRISTSKTQIFLWTLVVGFMLVYLTSELWFGHVPDPFGSFNPNGKNGGTGPWPDYIVLLGAPFASLVVAKASVTAKTNNGTLQKASADQSGASMTQVITNDSGDPDLVDTQYFLFNLAALTYVIIGIATTNTLPQIPALLLALSGTSAAAYAANKVATQNKPIISALNPASAAPGQAILISGSNFKPAGTTTDPTVKIAETSAMIQGSPTDTRITAVVPIGAAVGTQNVVVTTAAGVDSDAQPMGIVADTAEIRSISPPLAPANSSLTIDGSGFYSDIDGSMIATVTFASAATRNPLGPPQSPPITRLANGLDRVVADIPPGVAPGTTATISVITSRGVVAGPQDYQVG